MRFCFVILSCVLLLIACSSSPEPRSDAPIAAPPRDLVAEVRAAVAEQTTDFEVQPLRDPAVEDLRAAALRAESNGEHAAALAALDTALALSPTDPELRQLRAESLLAQELLDQAEAAAADAFEAGPRVGSLCLRSWHTVRVAREARGDATAAQVAQDMLASCRVEPPPRM